MSNTKSLVTASLFAALIAVTAFLQVPAPIPFTLQIMAIFIISGIMPTKTAFLSVAIYLCLGAVGLPVFSGFKGWIILLNRSYPQRNRFRIPQRNSAATFSASITKTGSDANARKAKHSKLFLKTKKQADS